MSDENTNWGQSVTAIVINDGKVLLARHTYGNGKGMLVVPGGYVEYGETPQDALVREYKEEVNITIKPCNIIAIRFNMHDWYIAFRAEYVSGNTASDNDENDEVVWLDIEEALSREDVPDLTKKLIKSAVENQSGLKYTDYEGSTNHAPYSLYCL